MAKKDSKLRTLSIAYAVGRIDKDAYRRLRTAQLSALDFDKPAPELPEELQDIEVPKTKLDLLWHNQSRKKPFPVAAIIIGVCILIIAIGIFAYIL